MARKRTRVVASVLIGILAIGAVTFALAAPGPSAKKAAKKHPTAKGHITNLYPGSVSRMKVTVKNPYPKVIVVKNLRTAIGVGKGALGVCAASFLKVKPWKGKVTIRPRRSKRFVLLVRMLPSAPDSCQGTRFPLRYTVKAVPKR